MKSAPGWYSDMVGGFTVLKWVFLLLMLLFACLFIKGVVGSVDADNNLPCCVKYAGSENWTLIIVPGDTVWVNSTNGSNVRYDWAGSVNYNGVINTTGNRCALKEIILYRGGNLYFNDVTVELNDDVNSGIEQAGTEGESIFSMQHANLTSNNDREYYVHTLLNTNYDFDWSNVTNVRVFRATHEFNFNNGTIIASDGNWLLEIYNQNVEIFIFDANLSNLNVFRFSTDVTEMKVHNVNIDTSLYAWNFLLTGKKYDGFTNITYTNKMRFSYSIGVEFVLGVHYRSNDTLIYYYGGDVNIDMNIGEVENLFFDNCSIVGIWAYSGRTNKIVWNDISNTNATYYDKRFMVISGTGVFEIQDHSSKSNWVKCFDCIIDDGDWNGVSFDHEDISGLYVGKSVNIYTRMSRYNESHMYGITDRYYIFNGTDDKTHEVDFDDDGYGSPKIVYLNYYKYVDDGFNTNVTDMNPYKVMVRLFAAGYKWSNITINVLIDDLNLYFGSEKYICDYIAGINYTCFCTNNTNNYVEIQGLVMPVIVEYDNGTDIDYTEVGDKIYFNLVKGEIIIVSGGDSLVGGSTPLIDRDLIVICSISIGVLVYARYRREYRFKRD